MNPGLHDTLHAMGPQAGHIAQLWNIFLVICTVVFAAVIVALLSTSIRRSTPLIDTSA